MPVFRQEIKIGANALNVHTGERRTLTRLEKYADFSGRAVGRYVINDKGIEHGKRAIEMAIGKRDFIIIDEVGPLELRGGGWAEEVEKAFRKGNVIAVIRENIKEKFFEKYGENFTRVGKNDLVNMLGGCYEKNGI